MIRLIKRLRDIYLKNVVWRRYKIGKNFHAARGVFMWARNNIVIGDNFYIGKYSIIETNTVIGDDVILANNVSLVGRYDHNYQQVGIPTRLATSIRDSSYNWKGLNSTIVIEDDVWIGIGTIVLSGVKIGQGSIVAAGSVVTKDIESFCIYGGNPAKKISNRFESEEEKINHKTLYEQSRNSKKS